MEVIAVAECELSQDNRSLLLQSMPLRDILKHQLLFCAHVVMVKFWEARLGSKLHTERLITCCRSASL